MLFSRFFQIGSDPDRCTHLVVALCTLCCPESEISFVFVTALMASFAEKVRGPDPDQRNQEQHQTQAPTTSATEEIENDLVEAITLQNSNATIHPTQAQDGETLPEGYSRSYGGFLLRHNPRIVPVDQRMVRREMEYLSRHVLSAFFVGGRPSQHSLPQWLEMVQRQAGGYVSVGRNLGRGFFNFEQKMLVQFRNSLPLLLSNLVGGTVSCKIGFRISIPPTLKD